MKLKLFFSLGFFWGLIFLGVLARGSTGRRFRSWEGCRLTFVVEAIGLMAFGLAWLFKG